MGNTLMTAGSLAAVRGWFRWQRWSIVLASVGRLLAVRSKALPCFASSRPVRINKAITSDRSFDHADRLQGGMLSPCCMTNWNELGEVH